jgi:hypothetical protein
MNHIQVRFVISELTELEIDALRNDEVVISKMILTPDDYRIFHYKEGDAIEVETETGNRVWCQIRQLEIVSRNERVILIFTLVKDSSLKVVR